MNTLLIQMICLLIKIKENLRKIKEILLFGSELIYNFLIRLAEKFF